MDARACCSSRAIPATSRARPAGRSLIRKRGSSCANKPAANMSANIRPAGITKCCWKSTKWPPKTHAGGVPARPPIAAGRRRAFHPRSTSMKSACRVLVTGAGGFIGHHLVKYLAGRDCFVRGVDIKEPEYEPTAAHEFLRLDLRYWENCLEATRDIDEVYALAANMGGIGFIESHKAVIVRDNTLINHHTIEAARINGVRRFLFTSSACVY